MADTRTPKDEILMESELEGAEQSQQQDIHPDNETEIVPAVAAEDASPSHVQELDRAVHLRNLGLELFHATQSIHALGPESEEILAEAFLIQDLSSAISKRKPFRDLLAFVQSRDENGISELGETAQQSLAAVVGLHHGKLKQKDLERLNLRPAQQREILTLEAIWRIAEGLDASQSGETLIQKIEPTIDGMWMVVDGPYASIDAEAATRRARLWGKIGYPALEVLLPAEAEFRSLPFPEPKEKIGIKRDDPLSEAGRKVMRYHFAQMLRHEAETMRGVDIEALHDMRVATRRLRAAFEVFSSAFPKRVLKPHLKGLRATGRSLGAVRDLDVFMEKADRYIDMLPEERHDGLEPLLQHWHEQREEARAHMIDYLNSIEYARFKRDFNMFLNSPSAEARSNDEGMPEPRLVRQLVPGLVYERMASVRAYETILENAPIEVLHMLRIDIKKLRYTVEYFREVMGKRALDVIENLKLLQDHLGDLHDAQVATQILSEFISSWEQRAQSQPILERENIKEVVGYLAFRHAERHQLLVTFETAWDELLNNRTFRRNLAQAVSLL
jgi:CHAD domain-containing protein